MDDMRKGADDLCRRLMAASYATREAADRIANLSARLAEAEATVERAARLALEKAATANHLAREDVIRSAQVAFVHGVSLGHDRAAAAIRALDPAAIAAEAQGAV